MKDYKTVLTIAGSDSSGGAGIQADIKSISANGGYAASIITALTAQNTLGVQAIKPIDSDFVLQQCKSVFSDISVNAVKTGVLGSAENIEVVTESLKKYHAKNIVIDPVMIAKGGVPLIDDKTFTTLKTKLLPMADVITPNIPEAEKLLGASIKNKNDMADAAQTLAMQYKTNILMKGGHLDSSPCMDCLYQVGAHQVHWFHAERINTPHTHGTGCSLSSALATYLAHGLLLHDAVKRAHKYLQSAIQSGAEYQLGHGHGPINHFYNYLRAIDDI